VATRSVPSHEAGRRCGQAGAGAVQVLVEELYSSRHGLPPRVATEEPRPDLGAGRTHDEAARSGLVGRLPPVLDRETHLIADVGKGSVRREAMEDEDIARQIVGREPSGGQPVEGLWSDPVTRLAAGQEGQSTQLAGRLAEGNPAGEHVLHAAVVLVGVVAGLTRGKGNRIDDPRYPQRVAKTERSEDVAHEVGQAGLVGQPVEPRIEDDARVDRAPE